MCNSKYSPKKDNKVLKIIYHWNMLFTVNANYVWYEISKSNYHIENDDTSLSTLAKHQKIRRLLIFLKLEVQQWRSRKIYFVYYSKFCF